MSLESKTKIEKYLNNQEEEIEVDAKEFLEIYMENISNYYLRKQRPFLLSCVESREREIQLLEEKYETLKKIVKNYEEKYGKIK